jgi:hypothetical protein
METDINFELKRTNKIKDKNNFNLFTFFYNKNVFFDILEKNLKLNRLNKFYIFIDKNFNEDLIKKYNQDKISLIKTDYNKFDDITYDYIFDYVFKNFDDNKSCIVIRPDIFLVNNKNLEFLDIFLEKNNFLSLSSIFCNEEGQMSKNNILMRTFYSLSQDCWIFKTGKEIDFTVLDGLKFNVRKNETKFNYLLSKYYHLLNDTETFKIMCKVHENLGDIRRDNKSFIRENIYLLPETPIMNKINLEQLVQYLNLSEKDKYKLKCYIVTEFNKFE